jgi:hypothetical protein
MRAEGGWEKCDESEADQWSVYERDADGLAVWVADKEDAINFLGALNENNRRTRTLHMAGDTKTAELLARIDALQRALGRRWLTLKSCAMNELREVLQ